MGCFAILISPNHIVTLPKQRNATCIGKTEKCDIAKTEKCDIAKTENRENCDIAKIEKCDIAKTENCDIAKNREPPIGAFAGITDNKRGHHNLLKFARNLFCPTQSAKHEEIDANMKSQER